MSSQATYEKLQGEAEVESTHCSTPLRSYRYVNKSLLYSLIILLFVSNFCTWHLSSRLITLERCSRGEDRSLYAGLPRDKSVPLAEESIYVDSNETLRDRAWQVINVDAGMIAVSDDFVTEHKLHPSQRFVWDKSKSVYLLNGYHALHCVRNVYISLMEFSQGVPQSRRWEHVIHCLDELRQEVICNADDTPRWSTADNSPGTGMGQIRYCRSWEKLEEWAEQYNACYRYINQTASFEDFPQIERYIWCPQGSPYAAEVEKVFGHIDWEKYPS